MSSRIKLRQEIERMKVMEEEKSQNNGNGKSQNNNFRNTLKSGNELLSFDNTYLPSLSYPINNINPNYDYCESYTNNPTNVHFNQDMANNCFDVDDFIALESNYHRRNDSPYIVSPACQYDKYNILQYSSDYVIDSKQDLSMQYRDNTSKSLLQPYEVLNNKNDISLSCPVTGERSEVSMNHAMSSCNFPPTPSSSVQGQYQNDNLKNQKDRNKKESHNRIERKRRDYINHQITELGKLIPSEMNSDNESKKNKGNILKNSVEYVTRLKNEFNNISNYVKETEMAFMLLETYRKRNQELENQIKTYYSTTTNSIDSQNLATNYHNYLLLHEQNQKIYQSNGKQMYLKNTKPIITDINRRLGPMKDKQLSPLENQIAFKIEPSSAHSSGGNNSLSTTYRIEEEVDPQFNLSHEMINIQNAYQITNNNHPSLPSMHNDSYFSSNTHFRCMDNQKYESMEC